ncbi:hypothetical protein C8R48DRAFT_705254, partial [Suillus tomentosus]
STGSDQIHIIPWMEYELAGVYHMVSTLLGIDPSVQDEVAVNMTWAIPDIATPYVIQVYFVYCSLSANTTDGVVNMQTNSLLSPTSISQPSTQWEMYQFGWSNTSWQTQVRHTALTSSSMTYILSILDRQCFGYPG